MTGAVAEPARIHQTARPSRASTTRIGKITKGVWTSRLSIPTGFDGGDGSASPGVGAPGGGKLAVGGGGGVVDGVGEGVGVSWKAAQTRFGSWAQITCGPATSSGALKSPLKDPVA